jgi:toxin ParE1/3/4
MKVIWTTSAINKYIELLKSRYTPELAQKYSEVLSNRIEDLATYPDKGRVVPEYNNSNLRELIYNGLRVIYKISGDNIYIQTIRNCREKLTSSSSEE